MITLVSGVFCSLAALAVTAKTSQLNQSTASSLTAIAKDFQSTFNQHLREEGIPGGAFVIVDKNGYVKMGTFGHTNLGRKKAIDEHTLFRIASLSKTFAATLTGSLIEDGLLSWDDPVRKYSRLLGSDGHKNRIKVKHILGHTSGFEPYAYDMQIEDGFSLAKIHKNISGLPLRCNPGRCYGYQNSVFSLIEPILKKATNKSYRQLMEQQLFKPLMMKDASVTYKEFQQSDNAADPHVRRNGQWRKVTNKKNYYRVKPAAGVNASVSDMAQYLKAQLGLYPAVISEQSLKVMTKPRIKTKKDLKRRSWRNYISDAHYGLGWRVYQFLNQELIYHGGWVAGYRSDIAYSKKHGVGIAIMLNIEGSSTSFLTTEFFQKLFSHRDYQ